MTDNDWLQHTHLEKLYGYLPGLTEALPAIFGLDRAAYQAARAAYDANARAAAERLLADAACADRVDALPFTPGQTILAVGDSLTDDLQSWAEILRHLLGLRRPDAGIRVVNHGLTAHTTAMVLRRWPAVLASQPGWILCALGGNDVTRVGPEPAKPQVSLAESIANLRELRRIAAAKTNASWVWLTPAPVNEQRVAADPGFRHGESTWRNSDVLALAEAIRTFPEPVVDLTDVFGVPATDDLHGHDGVHPTLAGQAAIARAVVNRLAER